MALSEVDLIQSQQITDLQNDVAELKNKLNAAVTKINTLITDMGNVKDKIQANYTASATGGGPASDAILKRLSDLDSDYKALSDHYQQHVTNAYNNSTYGHGSGGRSGNRGGGGSIGVNTDRYTDLSTATVSSTGSANSASVVGSYSTAKTSVISVQNVRANRAKRLARSSKVRTRG